MKFYVHKIFGLKGDDVVMSEEIQRDIRKAYDGKFCPNAPGVQEGDYFNVQPYDLDGTAFIVYRGIPKKMFMFIGKTFEEIDEKKSELEKDVRITLYEVGGSR